jgi:hypothetical protein
VQHVAQLLEQHERRDPEEVIDTAIRQPIAYEPHREFVREVLRREHQLAASGDKLVDREREPERSRQFRARLNANVQPSNNVAAGWRWRPGGELADSVIPTNGKARPPAEAQPATPTGKAQS